MNTSKSIGFGAACWAIMTIFMFAFIGLKQGSLTTGILSAIVGAIAAYWLAGYLKPAAMGKALVYGIIFVVVGVILDLLITEQLMPGVLKMWPVWFGYVLVLFAPLLQVRKNNFT